MHERKIRQPREVAHGGKPLFLNLERESDKLIFRSIKKPGVCFMESLDVLILFYYHPISLSFFIDLACCCISLFLSFFSVYVWVWVCACTPIGVCGGPGSTVGIFAFYCAGW